MTCPKPHGNAVTQIQPTWTPCPGCLSTIPCPRFPFLLSEFPPLLSSLKNLHYILTILLAGEGGNLIKNTSNKLCPSPDSLQRACIDVQQLALSTGEPPHAIPGARNQLSASMWPWSPRHCHHRFYATFPGLSTLDDFQFFPTFGRVGFLPLWDYFCGTYFQK